MLHSHARVHLFFTQLTVFIGIHLFETVGMESLEFFLADRTILVLIQLLQAWTVMSTMMFGGAGLRQRGDAEQTACNDQCR